MKKQSLTCWACVPAGFVCVILLCGCRSYSTSHVPEISVLDLDGVEVVTREERSGFGGAYPPQEDRAYDEAAVGCATHSRIAVFVSREVLRCSGGLIRQRMCDSRFLYVCRPTEDPQEQAMVDMILQTGSTLGYERLLASAKRGHEVPSSPQ